MSDENPAQNAPFPALGPRGRPKKPCEGASSARFSGKYGCRDYWGARLTRDFPEIAARVHAGVLSVNAAVIAVGLRKRTPRKKKLSTKLDVVAAMIG